MISRATTAILVSLLLLAGLLALLFVRESGRRGDPAGATGPITMYCAAGLRGPVTEIARRYREECGQEVQLQFGGSNVLLAQAEVSKRGDLYLAGERGYLEAARAKGLVDEEFAVAITRPVIGVRPGNPSGIRSFEDLLRPGVRVGLVDPEAGALGKVARRALEPSGLWARLDRRAREEGVYKPNVNDVANDVKLGSIDAALLWDITVTLVPGLAAVEVPELKDVREQFTLGVLRSSVNPTAALRFARYLTARDRGAEMLRKMGVGGAIDGDAWEERPRLVIFSGGVNRPGLEGPLAEFGRREGAEIDTVYNGCGILVAQMKGLRKGEARGAFPDAYFACDRSFMAQVRQWFTDEVELTSTRMVILTPKGNPRKIATLADLAAPGLKLGAANPKESALGHLTEQLLRKVGLHDRVWPNVVAQTPTADMLVNSMKAGSLDAAIVYDVNTTASRGALEVVPIDDDAATAVQPYAIAADTAHRQLLLRLFEKLQGAETAERYRAAGFRFRPPPEAR